LNIAVLDAGSLKTTINGVKLYPNPAFDSVFIESDNMPVDMNYRITDVSGKVAMSGKIGNGASSIAIDKLSTGTYLLLIDNACVKFVKGKG
jgi:hypothetical protein